MIRSKSKCWALCAVFGFLTACAEPQSTGNSPAEAASAAENQSDHSADHDHDEHHDEAHGDEDSHGGDDAPRRDLGAHLHGDAQLSIALDGATLFLELDTPMFNLTGFEHAPETNDERAALAAARLALANAAGLFTINPQAGCTAASSRGLDAMDVEADEPHDHSDDAHGEHDDEDHHDTDTHRDLLIEFEFECESPDQLQTIDVRLFDAFARIEELEVVYLDQTIQQSARLTPANSHLTLTR